MSREQEDQLIHDLSMVLVAHDWLTHTDWMKACQRVGSGYLTEPQPEGHQLSDAAAARFVEGLAEALTGAGLCEPVAQVVGTR